MKNINSNFGSVSLRKYPYPYRSMLSICSDLDETPDKDTYIECGKFLNTNHDTTMGIGVNLEVGNTIYFDMPKNQFSYSNTDKDGREKIHALIKSGHIDCLHSFGDFVNNRERAKYCLELLKSNNCFIEVWVDHAAAPTNIDSDILHGMGDIPDATAYVADLLSEYGIVFIWKGRVTSIIAQNTGRTLRNILNPAHLVVSVKTLLKEQAKYILAKLGNIKYAMHATNQLMRPFTLSNGVVVYEFMRTNSSWAGVSTNETADGIAEVITTKMLDHLVNMEGCSILYTHLGKLDEKKKFSIKTVEAFNLLATYYQKGEILISTTRRTLGYQRTISGLSYSVTRVENKTFIDLKTNYSGKDLEGLTWYVQDDTENYLRINGNFTNVVHNQADYTGRKSISIPWKKLSYPDFEKL